MISHVLVLGEIHRRNLEHLHCLSLPTAWYHSGAVSSSMKTGAAYLIIK
jgi:hypothetical protein